MARDPQQARRWMQATVADAAAASDADAACRCLTPLFTDIAWLEAIAVDWIAPMRADPSAMPGAPIVRKGPVLTLTLAAAPPVRLLLSLIEGAAERAEIDADMPSAIGFSGVQSLFRLLSRTPVEALLGEAGAVACRTRPFPLAPGQWLAIDERQQTLCIDPQDRPVLLLQARIERSPAPPERRFARADGRLLGTVQADEGFARSAMLLSVLRATGVREAVPAMIALLDRAAGRERWTVMRELIALDAALAWPHLDRMAAHDPDAGVREAARGVLARHGSARAAA